MLERGNLFYFLRGERYLSSWIEMFLSVDKNTSFRGQKEIICPHFFLASGACFYADREDVRYEAEIQSRGEHFDENGAGVKFL